MDLVCDDPCVLFALRREALPFLRLFRVQGCFPDAPCWARFCGPSWLTVLVVETGMGAKATEQALHWLLSQPLRGQVPYRPQLVLSAGFAGALQEGAQVGDVFLATEVVDWQGTRWPTTWPGELPPSTGRPPMQRGRFLTVSQLVATRREKKQLGQAYQAATVDLESALVARHCSAQGVPFGCVRAISDNVHTALSPRLASLLSGSRVSPWRLATGLFRSPGMFGELWRLARQTRFASHQLAAALAALLTLTLPGRETL